MADDYESQLAAFMGGIRREESGGNYREPPNRVGASGAYQFLDSTWGGYGGYQKAYEAPPEIQDERARQLMGTYYRKFGSWNAVAQAWLGGPGSVGKNVSDGNITTTAYARKVLAFAGMSDGSPPVATVAATGGGGKVGAGMSVGGTDQFAQPGGYTSAPAGPDLHNVDVQAQTILGLLSKPATPVDQMTTPGTTGATTT